MYKKSKIKDILIGISIILVTLSMFSFNCYANESLYLSDDFWNSHSDDCSQININQDNIDYTINMNCYNDLYDGLGMQIIINNAEMLGKIEDVNPIISYYIGNKDSNQFYAVLYPNNDIRCSNIDLLENYGYKYDELNNSYILNSFIKYKETTQYESLIIYITINNERYLLKEYKTISDVNTIVDSTNQTTSISSTTSDISTTTCTKYSNNNLKNKEHKYSNKSSNKANDKSNKKYSKLNNNDIYNYTNVTEKKSEIENLENDNSQIEKIRKAEHSNNSKNIMIIGSIIFIIGIIIIITAFIYHYLLNKIYKE